MNTVILKMPAQIAIFSCLANNNVDFTIKKTKRKLWLFKANNSPKAHHSIHGESITRLADMAIDCYKGSALTEHGL
jgi:hypothetical protein